MTLAAIERLNPDFVNATIAELAIKPAYRPLVPTALEAVKEILNAVRRADGSDARAPLPQR